MQDPSILFIVSHHLISIPCHVPSGDMERSDILKHCIRCAELLGVEYLVNCERLLADNELMASDKTDSSDWVDIKDVFDIAFLTCQLFNASTGLHLLDGCVPPDQSADMPPFRSKYHKHHHYTRQAARRD